MHANRAEVDALFTYLRSNNRVADCCCCLSTFFVNDWSLVAAATLRCSCTYTQEADFLCKAHIVGVIQENGWFFVSCTGCPKKLEKRVTSLDCSRCATSDVTGVVRFRVELVVDDGKDSATFVVFDKEMNKLTKQEADVLALDEVSNGGEEYLPSCLEELAGKEFMFQIRVTPFNFTPNHRTFTVATISEDSEAHSENSGVDTGLEASSSGPSVLGVKMSEERASGNHPGNADAQQKRKRGRE
ncbi:hypothetical protein F2Q68_00022282 [Brassica cretica]|uniref:Replication factor A C-terminal domain-containing protein n=1 Tax=Brassica cretica TaxID=69181 RepID=A0A8S9FZT6_BRACR|nr:hypothetical protein F2Q68_00022282 [Brassica cretica]